MPRAQSCPSWPVLRRAAPSPASRKRNSGRTSREACLTLPRLPQLAATARDCRVASGADAPS
eukprot:5589575-Pyramimonas_sp.AAC.1